MQIALIVDNFVPSGGSYGNYALEVCRFLVRDGHSVHLFSRKCEQNPGGTVFHKVNSSMWPRTLRELMFARGCQKELKKGEFDIVMGFSKCFGADLVRAGGGSHKARLEKELLSYPGPITRAAKMVWRSISPRTHILSYVDKKGYGAKDGPLLIAVSRFVRDDLIRYHRIPPERIKVIYNGVNIERFNPSKRDEFFSKVRSKYGIGGEILVLFVANNFRLKGLLTLIKAVGFLNGEGLAGKLKVMVVGKGDRRSYLLLALKGGWDQNLVFTGPVAHIERFYGAADIFVYPTFYDPCANVCLEALASGLPVITTKYNGVSEIIEDGRQGFVVDDPRNFRELADRIKFFLDDRQRINASLEARRLAERFSIERNYCELKKNFFAGDRLFGKRRPETRNSVASAADEL